MNKASGSAIYMLKNPNENVCSVLQLKHEVLFYKNMGGIPGSLLNDNTYFDTKT